MVTVLDAYALLLLLTALVVAGLAVYAWERRDRTGAATLTVLLAALAFWSAVAFVAVSVRGTRLALAVSRLWYFGIVVTVPALFVFAVQYTGRDRYLNRWVYGLLGLEAVVVLLLNFVNPESVFRTVEGRSAVSMTGWEITGGPAFWAHAVYSYGLVAIATVLIFRHALTNDELRRRQTLALLVSIAIPWFSNVLYLSEVLSLDPTPVAFSLTAIALAYAVFQTGFLDLRPVAYQELVDSLNSGVVLLDDEGRIADVNDAAKKVIAATNPVGEPAQSALNEFLDEAADSLLGATSETQVDITFEDRHFDVQMTPLTGDNGEIVGRVLLLHEMTEQKQQEVELRRRNEQLDRFASVVSHDLRNPLNVASGSLELARQTGKPEHFDRVSEAHDRMDRLIDELLTLARGERWTEQTELPLAELADAAWEHVDTADGTLEVETDRAVVGNRDQLLRLFENAFRNSVEHGGGDVTVTVSARQDSFTVADDGPGIPPSESDSVFEHGFTTAEEGTGLGLSIVEHVASTHGWDVRAETSQSGGFALVVGGVETLPAAELSGQTDH